MAYKDPQKLSQQIDPGKIPTYGISEAAHYLGIPIATLRSWVVGRYYKTDDGKKSFKPIIELSDKIHKRLSFINLVEAHVLNALRRQHNVFLPKIRSALNFLKRKLKSNHPLADQQFESDGLDIFIQEYGRLINISQEGQFAMRAVLQVYLQRIRRGPTGSPAKLYLFTRGYRADEPRAVVVDPEIAFGRPALAGKGIAISVSVERYKAGETMKELTEDYGSSQEEIEEAFRCALKAA